MSVNCGFLYKESWVDGCADRKVRVAPEVDRGRLQNAEHAERSNAVISKGLASRTTRAQRLMSEANKRLTK